MGEKYQSYATKPHYLSFLLGKGGNPYISKLYIKNSVKCAFRPAPQHANHSDSDTVWTTHAKLTKIVQIQFTLPQLSHLSSNRRVRNLPLYFQFTTPAKELTQRNAKNPTQKDTNFGNAMFLRYLRPEKRQKSDPERHEFWKRHVSLLPEAREMPKI